MLSTDQHAPSQAASPARPATDPAQSWPTVDRVGALRTAADTTRVATLEMLQGHGRAAIELAQARSAEEIRDLRRAADSDMAGIRESSKAEIARIQAEADERLAARTAALERDLGEHAGRVERELERISTAVATFAAQMEDFFGAVDQPPAAVDLASAFAAAESEAALAAASVDLEDPAG